ncbi:MAG: sugar transferase, partial [Oscillospiraceae bacterium]
MKNKYAIHLGRIVVLVIKILLFVALFVSFFALFAIDNPQIVSKSRTAAITMTTFFVLGLTMTAVYGGFAIGKKKSNPIIYSLGIATFITDFITYFQLIIMNTNRYNQNDFRIKNIGVFFLVLLIQVIFIVIFTYLGNYIYFKVNPPEKCLVICDDIKNAQALIKKIEKYKKQYKIEKIIEYNSDILKESIRNCDTVFISNVPALEKSEIIEYSYRRRKSVYSNMELYDVVSIFSKTTILDDTPMAYSNVRGLTFEQRFFKRIVDIVLSSIGLIIASPIMLIEALSIKLYDKGPVFFKQERATLNGKPFNV